VDRFVVISGCSGGGKSTLLAELARRGYAVIEEPGRRIVREELAGTGASLPWIDGAAFARRAIAMALADREDARRMPGWVFFDRGLVDAASALQHVTGEPAVDRIAPHHYHRRVFFTPPWPEIYATEGERHHDLQDAIVEYDRLLRDYPRLGYEVITVPKVAVSERADLILETLGPHASFQLPVSSSQRGL
jgi:predicted ATPase